MELSPMLLERADQGIWELDPAQLHLGPGMEYTPLIPGDKAKQIYEFKACLGQSRFQVKKSLNSGMLVHAFNPSLTEDKGMQVSEFKVNLQSKFQDSKVQAESWGTKNW